MVAAPVVETITLKVSAPTTDAAVQDKEVAQQTEQLESASVQSNVDLSALLRTLSAQVLPSMPETSIEDGAVPLSGAVSPEELEQAIAVLETVSQAEQQFGNTNSSAKRAEKAREEAKETLNQAVQNEKAAQETLAQAQERAQQAEAELQAAQQKSDATGEELEAAKKALEDAQAQAEQAKELADAKAKELESAKTAAKEAADNADALRKAADEAKAAADALKSSAKVYEAIAVLEKGITESGVNEKSQELRGKDYFEFTNALNSTGGHYAPLMNEYLEGDDVLEEEDEYTYRIYKCNGASEKGYNIFFVLESIEDKELGQEVLQVVMYNTVTGTYMLGDTAVTVDVEKNKVLNGGLFGNNAEDITTEAQDALAGLSEAESKAIEAEEAAKTAETDKETASKLESDKQKEADDAAAESEQANADLIEATETADKAEQADQTAKDELDKAQTEHADAKEQEAAAQDELDDATQSVTQAVEQAKEVGVAEQEIEEITSGGDAQDDIEQ